MSATRRIVVNATCLTIATSLAMMPLDIVNAAAASSTSGSDPRVESFLDTGCGLGIKNDQIASSGDTSDYDTNDAASGSTAKSATLDNSSDAPAAQSVTTPSPATTASAEPQITAQPFFGILRGPGVLVAPPPSTAPTLTPPPIPTSTPVPISTAGPVFLIRTTPTPGSSATPASSNSKATQSSNNDGAASPAPGATNAPSSGATASAGSLQSPTAGASPAPNSDGMPNLGNMAGLGSAVGGAKSAHSTVSDHPSAMPTVVPTLGPNQIAVLADNVTGYTTLDQPSDATGDVHVYYRQGVIIGDKAHYDGARYITMSGHTYIKNYGDDTKLYGDSIVFDMLTNKATLHHGTGKTSRGVEKGYLHYTADNLYATPTGHVTGQHASFSTCENPRGGYHVSARSIDLTPGEKLIARGATIFLGGLAVFFIPVLSIPLNRTVGERRPVVFAPELGYDEQDGFYVRARIGFGTTNTYYGYYRVEEYTRRGLGLGYVAFIGSRNGKRQVNVNLYDFSNSGSNSQGGGHQDNLSLQDNELFSKSLQGQFGATYTSEYGPYVSLPPSYSFNGTVNHASKKSTQSYSFSRTAVGSTQSTINAGLQDSYQLSGATNESLNLNFTQNTNSYSGITTPTSSFHINSLTHSSTHAADYTLTVDQTDSATPSGYNKVPEFVFHPHTGHGQIPIDTQVTIGKYHELTPITLLNGNTEPGREATRGEWDVTAGPALFNVFHSSTVSATLGGSQYYYSTGDLKAQTRQTVNMTTPLGPHVSNVIQYQEQNIAGPQSLPFQYLDVLGSVNHNAQETLSINNGGIYTLTLTTGTAFDHNSQPISYQLISRPSSRSYLSVGGSYIPGYGNGFSTTNVQVATPFGKDQDLEFTTNVDWKNKGRLENKNIYFRKIVGNCYDIRVSYNQDLKAVNLSLDLLAFPSHGVNFGFVSQQQAIFPQNFVL